MSDVDLQIKRVLMLSHLLGEKLTTYQQNQREKPDKNSWQYYKPNKISPTEIKRVMLVLRQETIKLQKMI